MTAGRVFRISPPSDGSKSTHQTSPRSTGLWKGRVGDHPFGPLQRLLFAGLVGGHVAVASFDILRYDVGTSELLDELTDAAPADGAVKALIDGLADSDCELSLHGAIPIRIVHVYGIAEYGRAFVVLGFCYSGRLEVPSRTNSNRRGLQRFLPRSPRVLVAGRYRRGGLGEHSGGHPRIPGSGEAACQRAEYCPICVPGRLSRCEGARLRPFGPSFGLATGPNVKRIRALWGAKLSQSAYHAANTNASWPKVMRAASAVSKN